jgi:hypothetical protein
VKAAIASRRPNTTVDVKPNATPMPPERAANTALSTIRTKTSIHPSIEFESPYDLFVKNESKFMAIVKAIRLIGLRDAHAVAAFNPM